MAKDGNETLWLFSITSANDSTNFLSTYVFTPAGVTAKRALCFILSAVGAVGFLGNFLFFFFLKQKSAKNPMKASRFVKNLNLYLRSLCLSDLLSCAVSLPLLCIQNFIRCIPEWLGVQDGSIPGLRVSCYYNEQFSGDKF